MGIYIPKDRLLGTPYEFPSFDTCGPVSSIFLTPVKDGAFSTGPLPGFLRRCSERPRVAKLYAFAERFNALEGSGLQHDGTRDQESANRRVGDFRCKIPHGP